MASFVAPEPEVRAHTHHRGARSFQLDELTRQTEKIRDNPSRLDSRGQAGWMEAAARGGPSTSVESDCESDKTDDYEVS